MTATSAAAQQHRDWNVDAQLFGEKRAGIGTDAHDDHMRQRPFTGLRQQAVGRDHKDVDGRENKDFLLRKAEVVGQGYQGFPNCDPDQELKHGQYTRRGQSASRSAPATSATDR
jgi:hypothetical protein